MKKLFVGLALVMLLALTACKSNSKGRKPPGNFSTVEAQELMQRQQASIKINGQVRNAVIPWTEDLRLSQAIDAAEYLGRNDPMSIYILRGGRSIYVSPRRLVSGTHDPFLEPGDVVDIRR